MMMDASWVTMRHLMEMWDWGTGGAPSFDSGLGVSGSAEITAPATVTATPSGWDWGLSVLMALALLLLSGAPSWPEGL
jgi:hypothetical protein